MAMDQRGQARGLELEEHLRALPLEMITVLGSHMAKGDQLAARQVSKQWKTLMLPAVRKTLCISPYQLSLVTPEEQAQLQAQQQQLAQQQAGGRSLRPRAPPPPGPAALRRPPDLLMPPSDFGKLPAAFPGMRQAAIRVFSRHGQRGEGVNARPQRLEQLFSALAVLAASAAAELAAQPAAGASANLYSPGSCGGSGKSKGKGKMQPGMELAVELDIDLPRQRHREAYEAALALARSAFSSIARLSAGLRALRLMWFDARLGKMPELADSLSALPNLARLELPMTPGGLLPALGQLTGLTALRISSVGEWMHMGDSGLPRHDEVSALTALTRLSELALDGWVCETTLADTLQQLQGLRALQLGEDVAKALELAPGVLSRLTALTTPTTLCLTDASQEDLTEAGSSGMGGSEGAASSIRAKAGPVLALPRLVMLSAHPPPARLHSGISRQQAGTASAAVGSRGAEGQGQDQVHKQPLSGAERRRQRMPQVLLPSLQDLALELPHTPDLGPLTALTRLHCKLPAMLQQDVEPVGEVLQSIQFGHFTALRELQLQVLRPQVMPPAQVLVVAAPALAAAAQQGHLNSLKSLQITRLWDGLVPEGWDYTTRGALGPAAGPGPSARLAPSSLRPKQHLNFLRTLPALSSLHLSTDRCALGCLPPSLTALTMEGLLALDTSVEGAAAGAPVLTPKLQRLNVLLAKHPRTAAAAGAAIVGAGAGGSSRRSSGGGRSTPGPQTPQLQGQPQQQQQQQQSGPRLERGTFCVLDALRPLLSPALTHLSFTATPKPTANRLDQLTPEDYGVHVLTERGLLPNLATLNFYVMPKHQWLLDCGQLTGLSQLSSLRSLSLESPLTGATRLCRLTALSALTQLTELVTGRLDDEAYPGKVLLSGMPAESRRAALAWVSILVAGRFGTLPQEPTAAQPGQGGQQAGGEEGEEAGGGEEAEEEGPGALVGSDCDVNSDDLLYESGEEEAASDSGEGVDFFGGGDVGGEEATGGG